MLLIKCKDCGQYKQTILASFQQYKVWFEATDFTEQLEKWPNCAKVRLYFKLDYYFEKSNQQQL